MRRMTDDDIPADAKAKRAKLREQVDSEPVVYANGRARAANDPPEPDDLPNPPPWHGHRRYGMAAKARAPIETVPGPSLLALADVEMPMICKRWIPPGLLIAAGRPKIGKTSRSRQKAVAAATGKDLWGQPCQQGKVLFLSLEEGDRLMGRKLKAAGYVNDDIGNIEFSFTWPARGAEGAALIGEYLDAHPGIILVIVDSLTRFRQIPTREKPQFTQDYEAVQALGDICKTRQSLSVEVIHHTTKQINSSDPIADISGTFGLSAAADSYEVLRKEGAEYILHCGGRYWDESDDAFVMERAGGRWSMGGVHDGISLSAIQRMYLRTIIDCGTVTNRGIASRTGRSESAVSEILHELADMLMVERTADGWIATEGGKRKAG